MHCEKIEPRRVLLLPLVGATSSATTPIDRECVFSGLGKRCMSGPALFGRAPSRGRLGPGECGASAPSGSFLAAPSCGAASAPGKVARQRLKKSRPISRVLSWTVIPLAYASPRSSSDLPGSPCGPHVAAIKPPASLFGLAPGGVCHAVAVATRAVRSYRTISPLPAPLARRLGGIFSVALSVGSRLPGVTWHRALKEPGLSSMCRSTQRLSGRLGVHHTQVGALMRGGLLFEDQRALISLIVACARDLCREARRLF